ncbi:MAG: 5-oxoprolinase subunit PxpB [Gammaproteobacteria bacterium]|nr:5-oxoprolinase subunit PxpB [Gammaproteobacteria bacterium]MDH5629231.1 5-oxoprolinase subunit PxpB [Gammaproteobacteria bacterium]
MPYKIVNNGEMALTIIFDCPISLDLCQRILFLQKKLRRSIRQYLLQSIPAYQSLTLCLNENSLDITAFITQQIKQIMSQMDHKYSFLGKAYIPKTIEIPVCYDAEFATDMRTVSEHCKLSSDEIIQLHSQTTYQVYMLGFLPGFLYLGGLDKQIHCPRKAVPAFEVMAGSVGIGGEQTGIYPVNSPGGWQIIGRTPVRLFSPSSNKPFIANPLDNVRFVVIDKQQFDKLSGQES